MSRLREAAHGQLHGPDSCRDRSANEHRATRAVADRAKTSKIMDLGGFLADSASRAHGQLRDLGTFATR